MKWPEPLGTRADHQPTDSLVQPLWRKSRKPKGSHHGVSGQCTWNPRQEGPDSFNGSNASFGFRETLLAGVTLVTGESWCPVQPDLKDRNVVVAVVLRQQGDLRPLPEWLLWVADFKVSGVKLEQSEHFYLDFKGVSKYKHINLGERWKRGHTHTHTHFQVPPPSSGGSVCFCSSWNNVRVDRCPRGAMSGHRAGNKRPHLEGGGQAEGPLWGLAWRNHRESGWEKIMLTRKITLSQLHRFNY